MHNNDTVPVRSFLLHITHYDPVWCKEKAHETPFNLELGLELVDAMSEVGLNMLIVDCADGVRYDSHPELARDYTVPMSYLEQLAKKAREKGIEVVPKLNFSQSSRYRHNDWFRPHHDLFDNAEYWRIAFELIDELNFVCQPQRFFHIGMDEDHDRAHSQYIRAIGVLRDGLKERGLRTIIWNDSSYGGRTRVHAEKCIAAEKEISKDIVQVVWDYGGVQPAIVTRLVKQGFEVWGAPGWSAEKVAEWKKVLLENDGKGLLLTQWIPCVEANRSKLLEFIGTVGPACGVGQYS